MPDHAERTREIDPDRWDKACRIYGFVAGVDPVTLAPQQREIIDRAYDALAAVERDTAAQLRQAEHDSERFEEMLRHCVRLLVIIGAPRPEGDDTETPLERDQREAAWACLETISRSCPDIVADSRGAGHA